MTAGTVAALALSAWSVAAQERAPAVVNGALLARPLREDLAATVRAEAADAQDVVWLAYAVPAAPGHDGWWGDCGVTLESARGVESRTGRRPVTLEPSARLLVLARLEQGRVVRLRAVSSECRIDAGGRPVHWFDGVRPRDSVAWLSSLAADGAPRRVTDGALAAIARHADDSALDWLLTAARRHASAHRRAQALFWLAQRAGQKAVGAIAEAVERDPDTEVKKRAVFALSQLPDGEGVPMLIEVARGHSNKAVQKQAFFWLGQSKDPRALAFFRDVLR